jgi:hypothetical protein
MISTDFPTRPWFWKPFRNQSAYETPSWSSSIFGFRLPFPP